MTRTLLTLIFMFQSACLYDTSLADVQKSKNKITCNLAKDCPEDLFCLKGKNICVVQNSCIEVDEGLAFAANHGNSCDLSDNLKGVCAAGLCSESVCGDKIIDSDQNESCDDGNQNNNDSCTNSCELSRCGDGIIEQGVESCDDDNTENNDSCTNSCELARCGDGFVYLINESCDDQNSINNDSCTNSCELARCGDGIKQNNEACDDGNADNNDACTIKCEIPFCGDGFKQNNEACDDGNADNTDLCTDNCKRAICGDGHILAGSEECDDGNSITADSCTNRCKNARCGDGILAVGIEDCDDGNEKNGDGCRFDCSKVEICGDGFVDVEFGEVCDDANSNSNDTCHLCHETRWDNTLTLGNGFSEGEALKHQLTFPSGVSSDQEGRIYVSDMFDRKIYRIEKNGNFTTIAGHKNSINPGNNGLALEARIEWPSSVFVAADQNVYFADRTMQQIRKITPDGMMHVVAGIEYETGYSADGTLAELVYLNNPEQVFVNGFGEVFFIDSLNYAIRKINLQGRIETVVGGNGLGAVIPGLHAKDIQVGNLTSIWLDSDSLYFAEGEDSLIYKVDENQIVSAIFGDLTTEEVYSVDGTLARYAFCSSISGLAVRNGEVFYSCLKSSLVRKINLQGKIETVAGQYSADYNYTFLEDGALAKDSYLLQPSTLSFNYQGELLLVDELRQIVSKITVDDRIYTVFGKHNKSVNIEDFRDAAHFSIPSIGGIFVDFSNNIFVSDILNHLIIKVKPNGEVETIAGGNNSGFSGNNGLAINAQLNTPRGIWGDETGNIYIVDSLNAMVRKIDTNGIISTYAGYDNCDFSNVFAIFSHILLPQDNTKTSLAATQYCFVLPSSIYGTSSGDIYVTDSIANVIVQVRPDGQLLRLAGTYEEGNSGEAGPAKNAELNAPTSIWASGSIENREVLFVDYLNNMVKRIDQNGDIYGIAGNGSKGAINIEVQAKDSPLYLPRRAIRDSKGQIWLLNDSNTSDEYLLKIGSNRQLEKVSEDNYLDYLGYGGDIKYSNLDLVYDMHISENDEIYLAEVDGRIMKIMQDNKVRSVFGSDNKVENGPFNYASLSSSAYLEFIDENRLLVTSGEEGLVRLVDFNNDTVKTIAGQTGVRLDSNSLYLSEKTEENRPAAQSPSWFDAQGIAYISSLDRFWVIDKEQSLIRELYSNDLNDINGWRTQTITSGIDKSYCCRVQSNPEQCLVDQTIIKGCSDEIKKDEYVDMTNLENARFFKPSAIVYDPILDVVYVSDTLNHVVRQIDIQSGFVQTIVGRAKVGGYQQVSTEGINALLNQPTGLALGANINGENRSLYIADTNNHQVLRYDLDTQFVEKVIGNGEVNSSGDGSPASGLSIAFPKGLVTDSFGNLYISSQNRVRQIIAGSDNFASGIDTARTIYGADYKNNFPENSSFCLGNLKFRPQSNEKELYVLDSCLGYLIRLELDE